MNSPVIPAAVEPLPLRLPRDLLVLQPMQGHLDLEPVLLLPGLRCVIGSGTGCSVRLTQSELVQPEHCVIEVIGQQTLLTEWTAEATWLNDRLVVEPRELVPGDRVSLGPFDFRLRPATPDELLYAKLVETEASEPHHIEDVMRLKRAIEQQGRDRPPETDLLNERLAENTRNSDSDSHERLTQHISRLLGDLQNQVHLLQDREADLNGQVRAQPLKSPPRPVPIASPTKVPDLVRTDYEQVMQLLQSERAQLERERADFTAEQARWHEQHQTWSRRLVSLESQLTELEAQRSRVTEEKAICRALAEELLRDKTKLADWEDGLHREHAELVARREELDRREHTAPIPNVSSTAVATPHSFDTPNTDKTEHSPDSYRTCFRASPTSGHTAQTILTLVAFVVSAYFLGTNLGLPEVSSAIGWTTALVGAISTVDLLLRRCFSIGR
jgi:hypothetical protein